MNEIILWGLSAMRQYQVKYNIWTVQMDRSSNNSSQVQQKIQQIHIEDEGQQDSQEEQQIDYDDIFEQARREQVLREINQGQSISQSGSQFSDQQQERHEEVDAILDRRAKREEKREEWEAKNQMKRLRQQDALQFFRKVKIELMLNFRSAIIGAKAAVENHEKKFPRFLSHLSLQTLIMYQSLKEKPQEMRRRKQFKQLLTKIFKQGQIQLKDEAKYEAIWALALSLGIGFRKMCFVDISQMDLESFYNLRYVPAKGKKKSINKQLDILRNRLQRKATQQQLKDKTYTSIESYSFDSRAFAQSQPKHPVSSHSARPSSSISTSSLPNQLPKYQQIKQMKRTLHNSFCQLYCPVENNWELYNMEVLEMQDLWEMKTGVLENRAIIGFYSCRVMEWRDKFAHLKRWRVLGDIELRDQTIDFCDKLDLILKRRLRLGCKPLYKHILRETNVFKNKSVFTEFQTRLLQQQQLKQQQWARTNFPKNIKQMRVSEYYVIPSLVDKYMILKEGAIPIPGLEFHEEKVYYKKDLERIASRMGWIDYFRMVKLGEIPLKTTQNKNNKNKTYTKLFKYSQTQPYKFRLTEQGDLILDQEYNSIYVPPHFEPPPGYTLIPDNVQYLCKKGRYKCARIVQGFDMAGSHIVPNNIGYMVETRYRDQIAKIYKEKQERLKEKKEERKIETAMTLWRKLFKSIIITQQVRHG